MKDPSPAPCPRERLIELRDVLGIGNRLDGKPTLRRDDCGDYAIWGRLGHIYAVQEGFQLVISTDKSPNRWTRVKKRLSFCRLAQDGDDEGTMFLRNRPTAAQAEATREAIGLHKKRQAAEATLIAMRDALRAGAPNHSRSL
jgi:hypothetical protein